MSFNYFAASVRLFCAKFGAMVGRHFDKLITGAKNVIGNSNAAFAIGRFCCRMPFVPRARSGRLAIGAPCRVGRVRGDIEEWRYLAEQAFFFFIHGGK